MRNIVWTNDPYSIDKEYLDEWRDVLKSEFMEDYVEDVDLDDDYEVVRYYFDDLKLDELRDPKMNNLCGTIKVVADVGRWCGRADAYKYVDDLSDIFYDNDCRDCTWYFNDENDGILSFYGTHHDGHNYYEYYFVEDEDEDGNETLVPITYDFLKEHETYL